MNSGFHLILMIEGITATHFLTMRGTKKLSTLSTLTQLGTKSGRLQNPEDPQPLGGMTTQMPHKHSSV